MKVAGVPHFLLLFGPYGSLEIQLVHQDKNCDIFAACDFIRAKVTEFLRVTSKDVKDANKTTIYVGWISPPFGYVKLNTDGASMGNPGPAGAGGVFRDHGGNWILGYSRNVGFATSVSAELWALRDGLRLASNRRFANLIVETDSKIAQLLLNAPKNAFRSFGVLISDCRALLSGLPGVQLVHVFREAKSVADQLAKLGSKINASFVIMEQCPPDLSFCLYSDVIENQFPRTPSF